jgi:hypothetical protein
VGVRVKGWVVRECWAVTPTSARGHTECVRLLHTYTVSPRELLPTDMTHSGTTARSAVGVETFNKTVSYTTEWASHSCDGHRERESVCALTQRRAAHSPSTLCKNNHTQRLHTLPHSALQPQTTRTRHTCTQQEKVHTQRRRREGAARLRCSHGCSVPSSKRVLRVSCFGQALAGAITTSLFSRFQLFKSGPLTFSCPRVKFLIPEASVDFVSRFKLPSSVRFGSFGQASTKKLDPEKP